MRVLLQTRNEATDQVPSTSLTQLEPVQNSNYNEYSTLDTTRYLTNLLEMISFKIRKMFISILKFNSNINNFNLNTKTIIYKIVILHSSISK